MKDTTNLVLDGINSLMRSRGQAFILPTLSLRSLNSEQLYYWQDWQ